MKMLKKKFKMYNPKLKEECAVFGISNTEGKSVKTETIASNIAIPVNTPK